MATLQVFVYVCSIFSLHCKTGQHGLNCQHKCTYPYYGKRCIYKCDCPNQYCHYERGCLLPGELDITLNFKPYDHAGIVPYWLNVYQIITWLGFCAFTKHNHTYKYIICICKNPVSMLEIFFVKPKDVM